MRILMLSDVYFPRINGVSTAIQTYRVQLQALDIDSILVSPRYGNEPDDAHIRRLHGWTVPFDREDRLVPPARFRAEAIRAAQDCDLVHIHTPFSAHSAGIAAARKRGIPVVSSYHTLFEEYLHHYARLVPRRLSRELARRISRYQCNQLDAVIVPSTPMAERLAAYGVGRPLRVLPTGIPLDRFRNGDRERFRRHYQIEDARFVALYVGRTAYEKNIDFVIDAFAQAFAERPQMLLLIAGEGPALEHLRNHAQARQMSDAVRFVGYLDRDTELPDCYAAADAFIFASRTETQGLVLLEAMAAGLPVVALAEMGTRDILTPASGALTPAPDVADFATALGRVADDADLRKTMSTQGRRWAGEWSDVALTLKLADLYRQLCSAGQQREILALPQPSAGMHP